MFVVASASFRLLYVMIILAHDRRTIVSATVTEHPTAAWLSCQAIEAFPWNTAPRYLLRDRDASYGLEFPSRIEAMNITRIQRSALCGSSYDCNFLAGLLRGPTACRSYGIIRTRTVWPHASRCAAIVLGRVFLSLGTLV